jgi:WW domain
MGAAFKQAMGGSTVTPWQQALDPKTQHIYYCNTQTGETTWSRPESMGAAPHATGWFGRGSILLVQLTVLPMVVVLLVRLVRIRVVLMVIQLQVTRQQQRLLLVILIQLLLVTLVRAVLQVQ